MNKRIAPEIAKDLYEQQAKICQALGHPVRQHILDLLEDEELNSSQLLGILEIPKANLSQHLSTLKDAGIIQVRREGLFQYWSLASNQVKEACALVRGMLLEKIERTHQQNTEMKKILKRQSKF